MKKLAHLNMGCTRARHAQIGIDAVVNARGGLQHLNDREQDEIELYRDAAAIRNRQKNRVRFYQVYSRFFRRHRSKIEHLISRYDD
jgi:hypothetical protein